MSKPCVIKIFPETSIPFTVKQGAIQTSAIETARLLADKFEIHIFHGTDQSHSSVYEREGIIYHAIALPSYAALNYDYFYLKRCVHIIAELSPRIVHIHNRPLYTLFLKNRIDSAIKLVLHEHNHNIRDAIPHEKAIKVLKAVDRIIEISDFSLRYDIADIFPGFTYKAERIWEAVNIDCFKPQWTQSKRIKELKVKYGIPEGRKVILYTGAIEEKKGVHLLIAAFKKVLIKHPDAFLLVAGGSSRYNQPEGTFGRQFIAAMEELSDNARYLGLIPVKDIHEVYLCADLFCGPSIWDEPFGLVFVEAMASGLPVVAAASGGIPEVVVDGQTGLLISDPENTYELAEKLTTILADKNLAKNMGKAGRTRVEKNFIWQQAAAKTEKLYKILTSFKQ
ncbi:glycosyltransferase family 4 protein [Candidatus Margulisiibacteriota bacterium]